MNARDFGGEKAKEIGDVHEDISTPDMAMRQINSALRDGASEKDINIPTQPASEKAMDTWNNNIGIMIDTNNPDASDEELWNKVKKANDAGYLRVLEHFHDDGTLKEDDYPH